MTWSTIEQEFREKFTNDRSGFYTAMNEDVGHDDIISFFKAHHESYTRGLIEKIEGMKFDNSVFDPQYTFSEHTQGYNKALEDIQFLLNNELPETQAKGSDE